MDNVIVYKANPESLQTVLGLLRKEGFNPATMENPGLAPVRSGGTYLISITVPRDESIGAKSVLRKWDQARRVEIEKTTRKLAGPLIFSAMVIVVLTIIFLFLGILWNNVPLLFVIWLVVFAVLAKVVK
jgi:acetolactate synthase regulatory subunit